MAAPPADIRIPAELLPADGRFGAGPSKVRLDALQALAATGSSLLGTSHRQEPVRAQVGRLQDGLRDLFSVPEDHDVLLASGGATAFWEMAAFGIVEQRSRHEVFGEFSGKFAKATAAAPWLDAPVVVDTPVGSAPTATADDSVDVIGLTHNETSTGAMMDIVRPAGDALVLVDATSGAGGLPIDITQTDAYYFSLQKGFASEGGLVVAILSPAAAERISRISATDRYIPAFFDLTTALDNSRKRQTYNTPSISTVFLAAEQVDWMNANGGLDGMVARGQQKADTIYGWAEDREFASPFVDAGSRSLVVATIDLDDAVDAEDVNAALAANGILDTFAYRKLGRNQLRVAMFPAIDPADITAYTACVDHVVGALVA